MDLLRELLSPGFMPHGHCYLWQPGMIWLQVLSNFSIGLAYMSISLTLAYLVWRIRDIPFQWMYLAFGIFIITCGFTHFMDVVVIWQPVYWIDGGVRAVTAVASVGTAVLLFPLVPKALALASAARLAHDRGLKLEALNVELAALYERTRETLAEAIPQLVWTAGPDGSVEYVNARWLEYTGEGGLGWTWQSVVHPEDVASVTSTWKESVRTGDAYQVECRLRGRDGEYRWFLIRALPLRDERGRLLRWFGSSTDIHDEKLAAAERERLLQIARETVRARDVFLAVAAHELRTPLTPLRLEAEGLLRTARRGRFDSLPPERLIGKLETVERQVHRLEHLVASLLDVSRMAAGRIELQLEDVDLADVARDVVDRHREEIERSGSTVSLRTVPLVGHWDGLRLEQVMTNLLTNAIRYGEARPITVEVEGGDDWARLVVTDRGVGIAPEDQERVFDQFERAAASERHYGGLGLGLWIVRRLVEALDGTVRVESRPGIGSRFTVELPRRVRSAA